VVCTFVKSGKYKNSLVSHVFFLSRMTVETSILVGMEFLDFNVSLVVQNRLI